MYYIENPSDLNLKSFIYFGIIKILNLSYCFNSYGKLDISCKLDNDRYNTNLLDTMKYCKSKVEYINTPCLKDGDRFEIYYKYNNLQLEEYWILLDRSTEDKFSISTVSDPYTCPSCNTPLIREENGIYCLNSQCPDKRKLSLLKFIRLIRLNYFTAHEDALVSYLLYRNKITNVESLFTLSKNDVPSVLFYDTRFTDSDLDIFLDKVKNLKGTITISDYLRTLPLGTLKYGSIFLIDEDLINHSFTDVHGFLDWYKFIFTTPNESPDPYMNDATYFALSAYLLYPENVQSFYNLDSLGIFK